MRRTKKVRTTRPDRARRGTRTWSSRDFTATAPNQLWVTDLTYVPTWAGVAYVCFIIDAYSRAIVGWRVASHMRTTMVLDAIEMARWSRGTQLGRRFEGLRCTPTPARQFTSIRYGERLAEIGAAPSIGTVGDSYDNALAETVNGYYKAELIRGPARDGQALGGRRGRRARHPGLGPLAQTPAGSTAHSPAAHQDALRLSHRERWWGASPGSLGFETVAAQPPQPPVVEEGALAPVSKPPHPP